VIPNERVLRHVDFGRHQIRAEGGQLLQDIAPPAKSSYAKKTCAESISTVNNALSSKVTGISAFVLWSCPRSVRTLSTMSSVSRKLTFLWIPTAPACPEVCPSGTSFSWADGPGADPKNQSAIAQIALKLVCSAAHWCPANGGVARGKPLQASNLVNFCFAAI
jgi:hypothetical protein